MAHGIKVENFRKGNPSRSLPQWVKDAAMSRGYGDAVAPLSLFVTPEDIDSAFAEKAHGNGDACVMAQAGGRLGAHRVYFYRSMAWVDFGEGPIVRYETSGDIRRHIITPFDEHERDDVRAGIYHLLPPRPSNGLGARQKRREKSSDNPPKIPTRGGPKPYMGRVVMGAQVK